MMKQLSDQEVLQAAIQKAINGGWSDGESYLFHIKSYDEEFEIFDNSHEHTSHLYEVIFDHDFAKALWGDGPYVEADTHIRVYADHAWQYHLQQLAIAEDRIDYLRRNAL